MKRRDLEKHLREHGCELHHEGGNHVLWYNLKTLQKSSLPRHREIKTPTARSVCKSLGIPPPKIK